MTRNITEMSIKQIKKIPCRKWNEDIGLFNSLVIIPGNKKLLHDSGYRLLDFLACSYAKPLKRLSGCSDVIDFNGIGGYGYKWSEKGSIPNALPCIPWAMDCLKGSGYLRIFASGYMFRVDPALSSFSLYAIKEEN